MTVYWVNDQAVGAADGSSEADAWTTIDTAMNTVIAGDKVWVKDNGNSYNETATIDTAGTSTANICFEGYATTTGDLGRVTIDAQSTRAACIDDSITGSLNYVFKNFRMTGSTNHAVDLGGRTCHFFNCRFDNNANDGVATGNGASYYVNCQFDNNDKGIEAGTAAGNFIIGCLFFAQSQAHVVVAGVSAFYKNVGYEQGSGWDCFSLDDYVFCGMNTVDGENNSIAGIEADAEFGDFACVDNIAYDHGTTGIEFASSIDADIISGFVGYNLINSNTADYNVTLNEINYGDVTGAPAFTDETGNDYTLGAGSPAIDAGMMPGLVS